MKKFLDKKTLIEILVVCLLGLTPLLWFRNNEVVLGHDAGLTISPITHFQDRLHAWTERFGFGNDQTYAIPGFFIHGLEALVSYIGFSLQENQKITFIFWFVLPGLTMYYFAKKVGQKLSAKYFALPVAIFYMFNHFLLQGWFVAERTKFSLYTALPLMLAFLFDWQEKKRSTLRTAILISITFFFLNGLASIPLFGGVIVTLLVYIFFYFYEETSWRSIKRILNLTIITIGPSILLQAYWLIPFADYVANSYSQSVTSFGGLSGILGWVKYISENSSFSNLFRLQGVPEWYQNPSHPYAQGFLTNPLLILVSFLFPVAAFSSLLIKKERSAQKMLLFFAVLALVAMIFTAGAHPPFGVLYTLLIKYVPGFIAFRTPFYKFSPALWFAYAILIGFTINYLILYIKQKKELFAYPLYVFVIISIIIYSYPFLDGHFFDYIKGERSMRVNVPEYIYEFAKWSEENENIHRRTLALPEANNNMTVDAYNWGYWSLAPITTLMTNMQVINQNFYLPQQEKALVHKLYQLMETNDPAWEKLAQFLKIDTFLVRNDFSWNLKDSPTKNPSTYLQALSSPNIQKIQTFGEWDVYEFKNRSSQNRVSINNTLAAFVGNDIENLSTVPSFNNNNPLYTLNSTQLDQEKILSLASDIFIKPTCAMCNLQWKYIDTDALTPLLTRGSLLYEFAQKDERKKEAGAIEKSESKLHYYSQKSLEDVLSYKKAVIGKEKENVLLDILKDQSDALEKLAISSDEYLQSNNAKNEVLIDTISMLRTERIVTLEAINDEIKFGKKLQNDKPFQSLTVNLHKLETIFTKIDSVTWRGMRENEKRFLIDSPEEGEYSITYRPNDPTFDSNRDVLFNLDEHIYERTPIASSSGWYSLGTIPIKKGKNKLGVNQITSNVYKGEEIVIHTTSYTGSCTNFSTIKGAENDIFRFSIKVERLNGNKSIYLGFVTNDKDIQPFSTTEKQEITAAPTTITRDFAVGKSNQVTPILCDHPDIVEDVPQSNIRISEIKISKLNVPELVLHKSKEVHKQTYDVEYKSENPTKYIVNSNENLSQKILILHESFDRKWNIVGQSASKIKLNGYANGWIIDENAGKEVTLEYQPERSLKISFIISGLTFFLVTVILIVKKSKI